MESNQEYLEEEDGPWYFGRAKEEFHRRKSNPPPVRQGEEDPIQVRVVVAWSKLTSNFEHSGHESGERRKENATVISDRKTISKGRCRGIGRVVMSTNLARR